MNRYAFLLLAVMLLAGGALRAQSVDESHATSITISPFHLTTPIVEITVERRVAPSAGMAGILGVGSYEGYTVFELGASYRYYLIGDFDHGMQVGGELLYVNASGDTPDNTLSDVSNGLGLSPFIGYKYAAGFGLTVELQGGVTLLVAGRKISHNPSGQSASGEGAAIGPLVNINFGWSF